MLGTQLIIQAANVVVGLFTVMIFFVIHIICGTENDVVMQMALVNVGGNHIGVFQIPGYYKYGSIKGRVFMYIPVAGFLVTLLLLSKMPAIGNSIISVVESSPILLVFLAVFAIVVMYAVSIFLSIRVMKNKEM